MKYGRVLTTALIGLDLSSTAGAVPVKRSKPIAGRIVAQKMGETAVLQPSPLERSAEVRQDLKAGDVLRTNRSGTLAIAFADRTQIRLGRNSILVVKEIQAGSPSRLELQRGALWGRTPRAQSQLSIETPSANAGIRGTSWSLSVDAEQTTLQVFDGQIQLANDRGAIEVGGGQTALARLGQAPVRIAVVLPDEREQMLYYVPFSDAARYLRPLGVSFAEQRVLLYAAQRVPQDRRTADDWLTIAEAGTEIISPSEIEIALDRTRSFPLSQGQQARILLVQGLQAIGRADWQVALASLRRASPNLKGAQRSIGFEALRLAEFVAGEEGSGVPESLPDDPSAAGLLGQSFLAAYRGDLDTALQIARKGERLYPTDADFIDIQGSIAFLLGDRKILLEAMRRGRVSDPDHPGILLLSAAIKSQYLGDDKGAQQDASRATAVAPGNSLAWNILAQVEMRANLRLQAAEAYRAGIAANPSDAGLRANRAVLLLDWNRIGEAQAELQTALELDPSQALAHAFRGRALIQQGNYSEAIDELTAASAASPTYAQTLLLLAYLHHRLGNDEASEQQLEIAHRYDPNSPFPAAFRAALALDSHDVGRAIASASASATKATNWSGPPATFPDLLLGNAFQRLGLNEWARFARERSFDPFEATSHFERAASERPNPFLVEPGALDRLEGNNVPSVPITVSASANPPPPPPPGPPPPPPPPPPAISSNPFISGVPLTNSGQGFVPYDAQNALNDLALSNALQGLALDPLGIATPQIGFHIFRQQFVEASASASLIASNGSIQGGGSVSMKGIDLSQVPLAYSLSASQIGYRDALPDKDNQSSQSVNAAIGAQLTPRLNVVAMLSSSKSRTKHSFHDESITFDPDFGETFELTLDQRNGVKSSATTMLALVKGDFADRIQFSVAGGLLRSEQTVRSIENYHFITTDSLGEVFEDEGERRDADFHSARTYNLAASLTAELGPVIIQTGGDYVRRNTQGQRTYFGIPFRPKNTVSRNGRAYLYFRTNPWPKLRVEGGVVAGRRAEYSLGSRFEVTPRQVTSLAYISQVRSPAFFELEPTAVAGLIADSSPAAIGTRTKGVIARWESEWNSRLFTAFQAELLDFEQLLAPATGAFLSLVRSDSTHPPYVFAGSGKMTRVTASANMLLTDYLALDAVAARSSSDGLYYLPHNYAKAELVWDSRSGVRAMLSATHVGSRRDDGLERQDEGRLAAASWMDASIEWRAPRNKFEFRAHLYNLFDRRIEMYNGFPRFGRTAVATVTARF